MSEAKFQTLLARLEALEEWKRLYVNDPFFTSLGNRLLNLERQRQELILPLDRRLQHLESMLSWQCESCHSKNFLPASISQHIQWYCRSCGMVPSEDWRQLYLNRHFGRQQMVSGEQATDPNPRS